MLLTAPTLTLQPAPAAEDTSNVLTLTADESRYDRAAKRWNANGNVVVRYRRYTLRADSLEYNEETQTAVLAGTVSLDDGKNTVSGTPGSVLTFHLRTREWTITGASTDVMPEGAVSPVHISAEQLAGTPERLAMTKARLTTCDPAKPQYEVTARTMTLVPDRQLVARHATAWLFGSRLATVPAITLPLRKSEADRTPVVPSVGQSDVEGFFIKTNVNYALGERLPGALRVDAMQRLGLGLGVRQDYAVAGGDGRVSLYGTTGGGPSLSSSLAHEQTLGGWRAAVTTEYRRKSEYILPDTTSGNATLNLRRTEGPDSTSLSLRWDETRGSYSFTNLTSSLNVTRKYSPSGIVRAGVDYADQSSSASSETLATRVEVQQAVGVFDVSVLANGYSSLSGGENVYRPMRRLPEVILRSDAWRLGLAKTKSSPLAFQFSSGHFRENQAESDRQLLSLEAPSRRWTVGDIKLDVGGALRQAVYASDAMQYAVSGNVRATLPLAKASDFALAWNYQNRQGYTPFRFDRPSRYNTLLGSLKLASARSIEFRAGTGYDAENSVSPWRELTTYLRIEPDRRLRIINNVAVSLSGPGKGRDSSIRYVNTTLRWRQGRASLDGDSRYYPETGRFGRLLGNLETPVGKTWSIRAIAGRDSGQRYRRAMVVKDLGCLEAMAGFVDDRGWRTERGVRVMLRIKAFPFSTDFEAGMFGENLQIGDPEGSYGGASIGPTGLPPGL